MTYDIDQFNKLRQAILTLITSGTNTTIQNAYFEQRSSFDGTPAAVVGMSGNEMLYNSNKADRMNLVFQILIYIPLPDGDSTHDVEENMGKAYWETLVKFNKRECLSGYADFVEPIPSTWSYEERGDGIYRVAEINIRCALYVTNQ